MDLNEIRVFAKVVQSGSFRQAGTLLGIPNSTVSAKVSSLERRLGVTLLRRTTRKLSLTEEGEIYFYRCLRGLDEIYGADAEVSSVQQEVKGNIRITAPSNFGSTVLVDVISEFRRRHPLVTVDLILSEQYRDLVGEGIDLAVRAGKLSDSALIGKKLGMSAWAAFASPGYLKKAAKLAHPKDLVKHSCLVVSSRIAPGDTHWSFSNGKTTVNVPITRTIQGNDVTLIKSLVASENGIAVLPTFACQSELKQGKIVRVLPDWQEESDPMYLIYPDQKFVPPRIRAFIELISVEFGKALMN